MTRHHEYPKGPAKTLPVTNLGPPYRTEEQKIRDSNKDAAKDRAKSKVESKDFASQGKASQGKGKSPDRIC